MKRLFKSLAYFAGLGEKSSPVGYLLILGPYHRIAKANEGWVSRVRVIDRLFSAEDRIYVNFSIEGKVLAKGRFPFVYSTSPLVVQYNLDSEDPSHMKFFSELMGRARACYAHNLHLAEHIRPWLPTGKVVVDMHGAVPEEELMLGNDLRADYYGRIEKDIVCGSRHMVVVSNALARHLKFKYPSSACEYIVIPICEPLTSRPLVANRCGSVNVIYCGSLHAWQNVPSMFELVKRSVSKMTFCFYSHDSKKLLALAQDFDVEGVVISSASKAELPALYAGADMGLVLRDDNPVNRVACPTKLYEYMYFGVVPVVRSANLGDFVEYGYKFIKERDLLDGLVPSRSELRCMSEFNFKVADMLRSDFERGCEKLLKTFTSFT